MLHWTIWDRKLGVHEASLRRYGSKLIYHITVFFIYISYSYLQIQYIDTINVPFCILQQLLKLTVSMQPQCKHDIGVQDSAAPWQISLVCFE